MTAAFSPGPPWRTVRVRGARPADLPTVAALCRRTVGVGDYVLFDLAATLRAGGVLLAVDHGRAVGMMDTAPTADGALWLSKARTDPAWQRKGVARAVIGAAVERARRRGLGALRLWTNADNASGNIASRKAGMWEVARFFGAMARPLREVPRSTEAASRSQVGATVLSSPVLADGKGYVPADWHFVRWSRRLLRHPSMEIVREHRGAVLASRALARRSFPYGWFAFAVLRGPVTAALREGRRIAGAMEADRAFVYLPARPAYRRASRAAGFETLDWGTEAVVYERRL